MLAAIRFPDITPNALAFELFGHEIALRWYALAYLAGLVIGWRLIVRLMRRPALWPGGQAPMPPKRVEDLLTAVILGVIVGGRLGFVLFYQPEYYLANPVEILKVWQGGMSFHGGFLGVVIACWLYGRARGKTLDRMLDLGAASVPIGLGLGRLANFINAELWGRPSDLPWAVIFPGESFARHPSQLYEALLEGVLLFVAVRIATHHFSALKHPGRASGVFATGYALSRIISEYFREPDAHIGYIGGVFTMGMILSLPLLAIGIWLLLRSRRTE